MILANISVLVAVYAIKFSVMFIFSYIDFVGLLAYLKPRKIIFQCRQALTQLMVAVKKCALVLPVCG